MKKIIASIAIAFGAVSYGGGLMDLMHWTVNCQNGCGHIGFYATKAEADSASGKHVLNTHHTVTTTEINKSKK